MLRRVAPLLARIRDMPWEPKYRDGLVTGAGIDDADKRKVGYLERAGNVGQHELRQALNAFVPNDFEDPSCELPGVEHKSDLPADPLTRIFFQVKGDQALYQGSHYRPSTTDPDRVQLKMRTVKRAHYDHLVWFPLTDFCHRIREGQDMRKRFVVVPSTDTTRQVAEVLRRWGFIAGFRDFNNDRAFVVELKYFQNEPVIQTILPASRDRKVEYEWSPKMMRRFYRSHGVVNKTQCYLVRTWDGRVLDHLEAMSEGTGGRGLLMCY